MELIQNLPIIHLTQLDDWDEKRPVALVTSEPAWEAVGNSLHLPIAWKTEVFEATTENWDIISTGIQGEVVYSVGGGLTADAAKYFAAKHDLPLVVIPTALSVDAFITAASGIRKDGCVYYIDTKPPDELILDLDVIAAAPETIRAAGITDVMSIATGSWDWKYAESCGKNPPGMEFIPWVNENARVILEAALDCAEAAGRGDRGGLKTLYDCLAMEVQLCNQVGHARPEEGTEHYFAYCAENHLGHGLPHGDLVGPGIIHAAHWQGQDTARLETALNACHIPLNRISAEIVERVRLELPAYCTHHNLPFAIAHVQNKEIL
jgi:glycerol-1-phosphate dehydrogenase [NAD(P)+]